VGKFVGAIIGAALVTVGLLVPGAQGLIAPGISLIATNVVTLLFAPSAPKPDAATTQKKDPTPTRTKGIGRRRVYGKVMLFETNSKGVTVDVLAFLDGRSHAVGQVYLNDDKVTLGSGVVQELDDGRYKTGKVTAGFNLGLPTETAFAPVVQQLPGIWTDSHRGDGITSGYLIKQPVKSDDFLEVYPQGDQVVLSAVFDMNYLFDPRDGNMDAYDTSTWVKADPLLDNPVLGLLWYLLTDRRVDYRTQILPVIDYWIAAANHCDEQVPLKDGTTERRYRCSILYDMTSEPAQIIGEILKTFDGWYSQDALGRYIVYSGRLYPPSVTIGPDQIVNARHQGFVEDEDLYNELVVSYISEAHDYNEVDTTPWRDEDSISLLGRENSTGFAAQTPSYSQNRRLAKRVMARQNASDRGTITTNYEGMSVIGQRYIMLNHVEAGATFYSGIAEIVTSPQKDMQTLGVTFDWVAVTPSVDTWNPVTEEGEPAPVGDRVAGEPLAQPTIISAYADYSDIGQSDDLAGSSVKGVRIRITANGPVRDDLTWYARWRVGSGAWSERQYGDADPGPGVSLVTEYVPYGTSVDVEVSFSQGDGRTSPWSATTQVDTSP
jgi:hypothetical protein